VTVFTISGSGHPSCCRLPFSYLYHDTRIHERQLGRQFGMYEEYIHLVFVTKFSYRVKQVRAIYFVITAVAVRFCKTDDLIRSCTELVRSSGFKLSGGQAYMGILECVTYIIELGCPPTLCITVSETKLEDRTCFRCLQVHEFNHYCTVVVTSL
jgi:hypothetical protein